MIAVTFSHLPLRRDLEERPLTNLRAAVIVSFLLSVVVALFVYFGHFSYRAPHPHGTLFGTIMAFNVWYRIWPAQQKIIRAVKSGETPDAGLVKLAGLRSRHNTYMSSAPLGHARQHTTYFAMETRGSLGALPIFRLLVRIVGRVHRLAVRQEGRRILTPVPDASTPAYPGAGPAAATTHLAPVNGNVLDVRTGDRSQCDQFCETGRSPDRPGPGSSAPTSSILRVPFSPVSTPNYLDFTALAGRPKVTTARGERRLPSRRRH
jgi:hypothetical protein